eukprot:SRR837773.24256.p1 GENE.SRR837773.24256~~SRR837773.24256.p1  ORF type:complete len:294 (+),score=60.28 SRR837773.24256:74-883(+)
MDRGGARVSHLVDQFRAAHLQPQLSDEALDADAELEVWKLRAQQDLLDVAHTSANRVHHGVLDLLKDAMVRQAESPLEQLTTAVKDAEDYQATKLGIVSDQCKIAESTMASACDSGLAKARARRRKIELSALKRWSTTKDFLDSVAAAVDNHSILQVGEAAQRCIEEGHRCLKLPCAIHDLQATSEPEIVSELTSGWDVYGTTIDGRLQFLSQSLQRMPETAETCAVAHGVLCLIDEALKLQITRLRAQTQRFRGAFIFADDHVPVSPH